MVDLGLKNGYVTGDIVNLSGEFEPCRRNIQAYDINLFTLFMK